MKTRHFFSVLLIAAMWCANSVWAATFTGTFQKITSTDDLTTGYYVIAASESAQANSNYIMGSEIVSDRVLGVAKSLVDSTTITNPDSSTVYLLTKTNKFTKTYKFYSVKEKKYLSQTKTASGGGMGWSSSPDGPYFECTGYNSSSPKGFKFTLNGSSNNIFKYNDDSQFFANYSGEYSSRYMTPVRLFKLQCSHLAAPTLNGDVVVGETSATISWTAVTNASGYEVKIYRSGEDTPIATQTVNETTYSNSSLTANTDYSFSIMAVGNGTNYCDSGNTLLEGNFKTSAGSATALDQADHTESATKIIRDGRLLILRGDAVFTAQGQKVE